MTIPYTVPEAYSIRLQLISAYFLPGTAYSSFESLTYTPVYDYSANSNTIIISKMGPIITGTTVTLTFCFYVQTNTIFQIKAFIDT